MATLNLQPQAGSVFDGATFYSDEKRFFLAELIT